MPCTGTHCTFEFDLGRRVGSGGEGKRAGFPSEAVLGYCAPVVGLFVFDRTERRKMHAFLRSAKRIRPVAAAAAGAGCAAALYSVGRAPAAHADSSGLWSWGAGISDKPSLEVRLKHVPECDPDFVPAVMWNRAYRKLAAETAGSAPLAIGLSRPGSCLSLRTARPREYTATVEA